MRVPVLLVCAVWFPLVLTKSMYNEFLRDNSPFPDSPSISQYLSNMAKLNELQSKIFGVKPAAPNEMPFDEEPKKPDQLPYLFEGDMVLTEDQMQTILTNTEDQLWSLPKTTQATGKVAKKTSRRSIKTKRPRRSMTSNLSARWTNFPIPFYISTGTGVSASAVLAGVARWQAETCVTFSQVSSRPNGNGLEFILGNGSSMEDYGVGYDYGSVMHYDQFSFTSNGQPTIQTIDRNYQQTIGQREGPSFMDVKRINLAYCNRTCSSKLPCVRGGYTDPKNCGACRCPTGLGGTYCERAATNPAGCGNGDIVASSSLKSISLSNALRCSFVITAPAGRRVYFEVPSFTFSRSNLCINNFLEIKYVADLQRVGARFCLTTPPSSYSQSNVLVVIYRGSQGTSFTLRYRYDPATPLADPGTTVAPTTGGPIQGTAPPPVTVNPGGCTPWSGCSATCGGCGTMSRSCGNRVETVYCNKVPCDGNLCCPPFDSLSQGLCFSSSLSSSPTENVHKLNAVKSITNNIEDTVVEENVDASNNIDETINEGSGEVITH